MNVKVRHFLMGIGAMVGENPIARLGNPMLARNLPERAEKGGKPRRVHVDVDLD